MRDCYVKGSMVVESIDDERIVLFLLAITLVIYEKFFLLTINLILNCHLFALKAILYF